VKLSMAALEAEYPQTRVITACAAIDEMLMIEPATAVFLPRVSLPTNT
jgi:hypothetical protein